MEIPLRTIGGKPEKAARKAAAHKHALEVSRRFRILRLRYASPYFITIPNSNSLIPNYKFLLLTSAFHYHIVQLFITF
jgi:hypothetical protein